MRMKDLLQLNNFGSWISEKMLWTSGIEWSSDISKLDEADFQRYGCSKNECYMLGELKKFVMDYVENHPNTRKPTPAKVPAKVPAFSPRDSIHDKLESLKSLGLSYLQTIGTSSSKLSKITLEIHWFRSFDKETVYSDGPVTFSQPETRSTTVYWKKNEAQALYEAIVQEEPQDKWLELSYGDITYQLRQFDHKLGDYKEEKPIDHANLSLLQQSIDTTPIPCTLKLRIKPVHTKGVVRLSAWHD